MRSKITQKRYSSKVSKFLVKYYGILYNGIFTFISRSMYHEDLKKQGDLRNSLVLLGVTQL